MDQQEAPYKELPDTDKCKGWELQEVRTCSRADLTEAGNSKRPGASRRRKSLELLDVADYRRQKLTRDWELSKARSFQKATPEAESCQRPNNLRDRELRFRHCKRLGPDRSRELPETRSSE
ncbi:hypothetical protein J6590_048323 [Homalodisca vitripennis]|nr:hypothetical protein J6590_048323 [Homalodisca vitripennis]